MIKPTKKVPPLSYWLVFESEHENFNWVDRQSLSTGEKEELVEYAMLTWQNRRHQNSWNGNTTKQYGKSYMNTNTRGGHNNHNNPNYNRRNVSPHTMLNPRDIQTGDIMQCHSCNSRFHLYRSMKCPNNAKALVTEDSTIEDNLNVENIFASEGDFKTNHNRRTGFGVLDLAATKTVCGKQWFDT